MFGTATNNLPTLGLTRQTSFGAFADTQAPFSTQPINPLTPNQPQTSPNPFQQQQTGLFPSQTPALGQTVTNINFNQPTTTATLGLQVPGQLNQTTPSFTNLNRPIGALSQTPVFGQQPVQPAGLLGGQSNPAQSIFPQINPSQGVNQNQVEPKLSSLD